MAIVEIGLDVTKPQEHIEKIEGRQGDTKTIVRAHITDDGEVYDFTDKYLEFDCIRPDGEWVRITDGCTNQGNGIWDIELPSQATAYDGLMKLCYCVVKSNTDPKYRESTQRFLVDLDDSSTAEAHLGPYSDQVDRLLLQVDSMLAAWEVEQEREKTAFEAAQTERQEAYTTAEAERDTSYQTAEETRNTSYTTAEATRNTSYESAEATRNTSYQQAETTRQTNSDEAAARANTAADLVDTAVAGQLDPLFNDYIAKNPDLGTKWFFGGSSLAEDGTLTPTPIDSLEITVGSIYDNLIDNELYICVSAGDESTAVWRRVRPEYKVTLNLNGGNINEEDNLTSYSYGIAETLPTPNRIGYTFAGWYTTNDFTGDAVTGIAATETGDKTFYAKWNVGTFTVTFNAIGGTVDTASKQVDYDATYGDLPTPTKTGYAFDGWYTGENGGTLITADSTVQIMADLILYAHWTAITYKVVYKANGGVGDDVTDTVTYDTSYTIQENAFTYEGMNFVKWNTLNDGTGTDQEAGASVSNLCSTQDEEYVLYAQWESALPTKGLALSSYSWDDLSKLSSDAAANPSDYTYLVGQTKSIAINGYGSFDFQIIGIAHDEDADGNKLGFTFQSVALVTTHNMNSSNTTSGGWASTAMKSWMNSDLLTAFPTDLQALMKEANKSYCTASSPSASSTVYKTASKLWIPSYMEVYGNTSYGKEGTQYQYWSEHNSDSGRIKYLNGSSGYWWLRSIGSSSAFLIVFNGGFLGSDGASGTYGVSPCFCI